jgi:hypothetical protein
VSRTIDYKRPKPRRHRKREKGALIRNYMTSIASLIYKIFEKE